MSKRNAKKIQMLETYNMGLASYKQRNFEEALTYFNKVLDAIPEDKTTQLYIDRCHQFIKDPPPPDWDGVFVMTTK